MEKSKKHGIIAIILSLLGILFPIFSPFALWQGFKAKKLGSSAYAFIGFLLANIAMAFFVLRIAFIAIGFFKH